MGHAHWGLIALAFVLGLVLTFALMIRRVKREVPVRTSTSTTAAGGRSGAETGPPTKKVSAPGEAETTKLPAADAAESNEKPQKDQAQ
jgi:uncharacterized membrane protein ArfC